MVGAAHLVVAWVRVTLSSVAGVALDAMEQNSLAPHCDTES